jgi:cell division protein FtsZ
MKGAQGVLINITGGLDMTLHEVDEAANRIREEVDADANIIFGSTFDASMQGRMRVSVVATGIATLAAQQPAPNYLSLDMNRPLQTGQPALMSRAAAPVGRVAMPAAAAAPVAPPAAVAPAPLPPAPPPVASPLAAAEIPPRPVAAPAAAAAPPVEFPELAPAGTPEFEVPVAPPAAAMAPPPPAAVAPPAPAAVAQRPLVDENDWRVNRPAAKAPVRAEAPTRPVAARPAVESRSPNLFQRITGAFAPAKPVAPPPAGFSAPSVAAEPPPVRSAPEHVVPVAQKPAGRPAPVQTSISLDVTERAKPARDDDDLQIPAFLRRQAN